MITSLRLGNFKAIGQAQDLPIRPLTLLFGPNSSGKSSVLHGLLFGCQAARKGKLDVHQTDLGGEVVDLGGFQRFVYRRQLSSQMEWGATLGSSKIGGAFSALGPDSQVQMSCLIGMSSDRPEHELPLFHGGTAGLITHLPSRERPRVSTHARVLDRDFCSLG